MSQNADVRSRRTVTFILGSLGFLFFALAIWLFVIKPGQNATARPNEKIGAKRSQESPDREPNTVPPSGGRVGYQKRYELKDGKEISRTSFRQFSFWTPSVATKTTIYDDSKNKGQRKEWQSLGSEEKTETLSLILSGTIADNDGVDWKKKGGIVGWRRYRVYGSGSSKSPDGKTSSRKEGWWWTMTVDDNFYINKFLKLYREVYFANIKPNGITGTRFDFPDEKDPLNRAKWKSEDIYIEELDLRSSPDF